MAANRAHPYLCAWAMLLCSWLPQAHAEAALTSQLRLSIGGTQRSVAAPSDTGARRLDLGPTLALALGIDAAAHSGSYQLGFAATYRTSVLGRVHDADNTSLTPVRSHQLELGARAGLAFPSCTLGLFTGYALRAFASVAELGVPRFSLHGPVLRLELELPLPAADMRLRLAPEAQWLPSISAELRSLSGISGSALAVGGEAQLLLPLRPSIQLYLDYRQSHAWASARAARSFSDVERYLFLGASYTWL